MTLVIIASMMVVGLTFAVFATVEKDQRRKHETIAVRSRRTRIR